MPIKNYPYWWEEAHPPKSASVDLPSQTDVVIVGAGYTGLSAALTLARAGREVVVLDAEDPGTGASSRNAGYFGYELRASLSVLIARFGKSTAVDIAGAGFEAFKYSKHLIETEQIQCDLSDIGRITCAHRPSHYDAMAKEAELAERELGIKYRMLNAVELREQLGTDIYHGAKLALSSYGMHPGKYLCGLLQRVNSAGATIAGNTPVTAVDSASKTVTTARGRIKAQHIIVATNGYTGDFAPELKRRLIPVGAHMIATEELSEQTMRSVFPVPRLGIDTRKMYRAFRPSPDGKRVLLTGRTAGPPSDTEGNAEFLRNNLIGIFPQLRDTRITHTWGGYVSFTFDKLPHLGEKDGIHYAMGFNGAGSTMGPYLGHKIALKVMGDQEGECLFDRFEFKSNPLYRGSPWFLPLVKMGYRCIDRFGR